MSAQKLTLRQGVFAVLGVLIGAYLLVHFTAKNKPKTQAPAIPAVPAAAEINPLDVVLPGTEENDRPSLSDMLSMPPVLGVLKLEQLYRFGENASPIWPVVATYGTDWMAPNMASIECELAKAAKLHCPKNDGWKYFKLGTAQACKKMVPEGDAMVRWLRDNMDCLLSVHPEAQSNTCRITGECAGFLDGVAESAQAIADHLASGSRMSATDEAVRMAIRHGKHHK